MRKNLLLLIIFVLILIVAPQVISRVRQSIPVPAPSPTASTEKTITVGGNPFKVMVAKTDMEHQKGLSGVESLSPDGGMLFIFPQKDTRPVFWMKDMLIPLDFIWINDDKVVQVYKNIPAPTPGTRDSDLTLYTPNSVVDYVLEVNAGVVDKQKIKVGDLVDLTQLNN